MLATIGATSVYFRLYGINDDMVAASFPQDLALSLPILVFLSSTVVKPSPLTRLGPLRKLADVFSNFSFTLYVVHVPVQGMLGWLGMTLFGMRHMDASSPLHLLIYLAMLGAVLMFAYGFYCLFEARTYQVRRAIKSMLVTGPPGLRTL